MTPLVWAGIAVAVVLAGVFAWLLWRGPRRVDPIPFNCERCGFSREDERQVSNALDVIAESDRRRAEHMNRTLRRAEGGDEHG